MKPKADKASKTEAQEARGEREEAAQEPSAAPPEEKEGAESKAAAGGKPEAEDEPAPAAVDWEAVAKEQEKLAADMVDRLQRAMAEFDNYRKRTIKEKASIYDDGVKDAIEKLLPVVDNFERALAAADDKDGGLYKGVEMTFRQLSEILARMGVAAVPGEGEPFDPNVHHAMAHAEDETLGENVVAEVLLKGYKYKDKVLRPSMVKVAN
jgi:molecular chaperone GrpE